ncbi:hypothetical protein O3Q52_00170 [Streptomyces sp. ActVer]|uniref:thiolase C-terminal domain-containing protein n=1 Tax=Streptomyces sp. ActVer TaxID=3014558 RepID=UPI0022B3CBE5|nr:hypothetical protein [Streptomyces sp. ActVer]MCZ4506651.1 hypothetical protein [Streptomyces sp. ActVer]
MEQLLQELRSFLDAEVPRFREKWGDDAGSWEARCAWQRTTAGGKWPAPAWSEEHGGRGACVATLASDDVHGARTTVSDDAAGGRLSGANTHVLDAHIADVLLVTAVRGERVQLFAVDPRAEGVELRPLTVLDHTRRQFRGELTDVKGQLLDEDFGAGLSLTLYVAAVRFPGGLGHGPERGGADRRRRRPFMVYDAYARIHLYGVEDLGCVGRGEAVVFIESGATRPGGSLPMNTNGGGLLYTHAGMYGMFAIQGSASVARGCRRTRRGLAYQSRPGHPGPVQRRRHPRPVPVLNHRTHYRIGGTPCSTNSPRPDWSSRSRTASPGSR